MQTPEVVKELQFHDTVAFFGHYLRVDYMAQMIEPGEIADIIIIDYHEENGDDDIVSMVEHGEYPTCAGMKGEGDLISAIYEQHGDAIVECMGELFP